MINIIHPCFFIDFLDWELKDLKLLFSFSCHGVMRLRSFIVFNFSINKRIHKIRVRNDENPCSSLRLIGKFFNSMLYVYFTVILLLFLSLVPTSSTPKISVFGKNLLYLSLGQCMQTKHELLVFCFLVIFKLIPMKL
jgi:hypothetical protein